MTLFGVLSIDCYVYEFQRAEYGAFWKCVTAGMVYMVTQLAKMLFLATFFPTGEDDDDAFWSDEKLGASDEALPFIFITVN